MRTFIISILILFSIQASAEELNLDQYKGKVVYLDFWASWCGPCKESFPWLNKISKDNPGLVVIGINLNKEKKDAEEFLKKYTAEFKVIYNSSGSLAEKFKVKGMPYSIIFDKTGKRTHSHIGFTKEKSKDYLAEIKKLMGKK